MSTPEGKIKDMVRRGLAKLSHIYRFMPVQNGMGAPGLDFFLCAGGWFIAIETKVKGKKPTPRQETTIAAIEAAHGIVLIVDDQESCDRAMEIIGACCMLAAAIRLPPYQPQQEPVNGQASSLRTQGAAVDAAILRFVRKSKDRPLD